MKKYINVIFVFIMLLFIPLGVNAENTCDASKVTVKSIELVSKTDNVEEKNNPEVDTNNLLMDLKMSEVEDSITYKIIINNNTDEDFKLNTKSLSLIGNYLDYEIEFENESVIKKNEDNVIFLKVKYNKEVPSTEFINGMFNGEENASIYLKNGRILNVPNALKNHTLLIVIVYIITILSVIVGASILIHEHKRVKPYYLVLLLPLFFIPISASAECSYTVNINTKFFVKEKIAMFDTGLRVAGKFKYLAGTYQYNSCGNCSDTNVLHIKRSYDAPDTTVMDENNIVSSPESDINIYAWFEDSTGTIYYYTDYAKPFINKNAFDMFYGFKGVKDIDITTTNMYYTEDMGSFLSGCIVLEEIDLSHLGGDNINDIRNFFSYSESLKKVDMSYFNFGQITNMSGSNSIFYPLKSVLEKVSLSHANMSNVLYASELLYMYSSLKNVDISYLNIEKVTNFNKFISYNNNLEELTIDHANFKGGTTLTYMFAANKKVKKMIFDGVNIQGAERIDYVFKDSSVLEELDMSGLVADDDGLKTPNVTTFNELLVWCSNIKKVNLEGLGGPNLGIVSSMLGGYNTLEELNLKDFNFGTASLSNLSFSTFSNVHELDLSNLDLSRCYLSGLLRYSRNITKISFENTKMSANLSDMFYDSYIEEVNFKNADFEKTTNMYGMFNEAIKIKKIDFSEIKNANNVTTMENAFNSCKALEEIDLSVFKVNNVTSMKELFYLDSKLSKVNVSGFVFDQNVDLSEVFFQIGTEADKVEIIGANKWKINGTPKFYDTFYGIGNNNAIVTLGDFSDFTYSTSNDMGYFMGSISSSNVIDIGTLKINANNIQGLFRSSKNIKGTLVIEKNPSSYSYMFDYAVTGEGSLIKVNYKSNVTESQVQNLINTKSSNSNVVLGELID